MHQNLQFFDYRSLKCIIIRFALRCVCDRPVILPLRPSPWVLTTRLCVIEVAVEREVEGDMILSDMGEGMPFRAGMFDGVIRCERVLLQEFTKLTVIIFL